MMTMSKVLAALTLCAMACAKKERSENPSMTVSSTVATLQSSSSSTSSTQGNHATVAPAQQDTPSSNSSALTCIPKILRAHDTLMLRMQTPHGDYLTANQPDGSLFFIVYPPFDDPSRKFSLMPSDQFKTTARLQLPADVRAIPWHYGRDTTEIFFRRPGRYVLWVGENLESDINRHAVKCEVVYQP
jgi:hypothetical protein